MYVYAIYLVNCRNVRIGAHAAWKSRHNLGVAGGEISALRTPNTDELSHDAILTLALCSERKKKNGAIWNWKTCEALHHQVGVGIYRPTSLHISITCALLLPPSPAIPAPRMADGCYIIASYHRITHSWGGHQYRWSLLAFRLPPRKWWCIASLRHLIILNILYCIYYTSAHE